MRKLNKTKCEDVRCVKIPYVWYKIQASYSQTLNHDNHTRWQLWCDHCGNESKRQPLPVSVPPTATETAVVNVNTGKNTKNSASNLFPNSTTSSKAKSTSCLIQTARPGNTIKTTRTKAEAEYTYSKELREAKRNEGTHEILEVDLRAQPKA